MNIEKAIEILKDQKLFTPLGQACHVAISALEKQIAKKPSEQSYNQSFMDEEIDDGVEYLCPNCKSIVGAYSNSLEDWLGQQKHCEDCGQKIDWEVENE